MSKPTGGRVAEWLVQLIAKQVDDRGLVVWYDPEQAYGAVARELAPPKTTVARYDGGFLKPRQGIDHLLNDERPPRLVVHVPLERAETHSALVELECAGVVMQPRQQPPACNTRLSVVGRGALKSILGEDQVAEIERQAEAGKLSLADLNSLADRGKGVSTGVLALVFGSANPQEVALAFLRGDQHDEEIGKKECGPELRRLLQANFDVELPAPESLASWRHVLGRHLLLTDLLGSLKHQAPAALASVPAAQTAGGGDACVRLARTWRNSRDARDSYVTAANKVEDDLGLGRLELPVESIKENETFLRLDKDMLFKARQNYVDPKIRLEQTRLDSPRSQKTALAADAKGAKKIDKDIERQEALLGELKDFADKLERAAKLNFGDPAKRDSSVVYDPDLNDGVVLNIAPLWELVPWKEAKNSWEELLEGKYEWSSMGKLLRKKGLVK